MNKGITVKISGKLLHFVERQTDTRGMYESASEYIRALVKRDYEEHEQRKWVALAKELAPGARGRFRVRPAGHRKRHH